MTHKSGVLLHVHHLETAGWEALLWGEPQHDTFGSLATLVWLLLTRSDIEHIDTIVLGNGPSFKDGFGEGEYTKQRLLDYATHIQDFARLRPMLDALTPERRDHLYAKLNGIILTPEIRNTRTEITAAATIFAERGVTTVYEISAASHAPRCAQLQATLRQEGSIPASQLWLLTPTEMCFNGSRPDDTIITEPPHRGDDPLIQSGVSLSAALKPAVYMPADIQQQLAGLIHDFTLKNMEHAGKNRITHGGK